MLPSGLQVSRSAPPASNCRLVSSRSREGQGSGQGRQAHDDSESSGAEAASASDKEEVHTGSESHERRGRYELGEQGKQQREEP